MHESHRSIALAAILALGSLSACAREPAVTAIASNDAPAPASAASALPRMVVHKSESCGCCIKWVEHMQQAGFEVEVRNVDNVHPVKLRVGVPPGKGSCHTAEIDGYFLEGHVPAADVKRLLTERPAARGLAVPGMPVGSPGMEAPDGRVQAYDVELVASDGSVSRFSRQGE
jgi:hypothetical protein